MAAAAPITTGQKRCLPGAVQLGQKEQNLRGTESSRGLFSVLMWGHQGTLPSARGVLLRSADTRLGLHQIAKLDFG